MFTGGICPEYSRLLSFAADKARIHNKTVRELLAVIGDRARFAEVRLRAHVTLAEVRAAKEMLMMHCREHTCREDLRFAPRSRKAIEAHNIVVLSAPEPPADPCVKPLEDTKSERAGRKRPRVLPIDCKSRSRGRSGVDSHPA